MIKNVGVVDKVIRIVLGIALLSLVVVLKTDARWIGLVGIVPLLTGLISSCPLYALLGVNTCRVNDTTLP